MVHKVHKVRHGMADRHPGRGMIQLRHLLPEWLNEIISMTQYGMAGSRCRVQVFLFGIPLRGNWRGMVVLPSAKKKLVLGFWVLGFWF